MPKSRKRKLTYGQRVKGAVKRAKRYSANREKVMPIYMRAMPEAQDYPPAIYTEIKKRPAGKPTPKTEAVRHAPGTVVELDRGRKYRVQHDGSWKREAA